MGRRSCAETPVVAPAELVSAEARRWLVGGRVEGRGGSELVAAVEGDAPVAVLAGVGSDWCDAGGLPAGTLPVAAGRVLALAARAAALAGNDVEVDGETVVAAVLLPLVVAAASGTPPAARPPEPWPTADGAVCADLGAEGDADAFARLLEVLEPGPLRAEELAARAQEWRLPVTPYRRRPAGLPPAPQGDEVDRPAGRRCSPRGWPPLAGLTVVDLTAMWSGPLCTALLAALGARVLKVEPDCRLDGTRSSPGGGLFRALNGAKERLPLDLRRADDRATFLALVGGADLVVDNFSPRVPANLGIDDRALAAANPELVVLHLPAFPPGPQRHWVSYGTGVHALSGLGDVRGEVVSAPPGRAVPRGFAAPAVTYPDPLGGLAGALTALAGLDRRHHGGHRPGPLAAEVPLAGAVAPLLGLPDRGSLLRPPDPGLVERLAARFGPVPPTPFHPAAGGGRRDNVASATRLAPEAVGRG